MDNEFLNEVLFAENNNSVENQIDNKIESLAFWQPEGTTLTVAALFLKNGTIVIGHSVSICKQTYDVNVGQKLAFEDAKSNALNIETYALIEQLTRNKTRTFDI